MFLNRYLTTICYLNGGWTIWHYHNYNDTVEEMEKFNYFQPINMLLKTGDIVYLVGKDTVKQMYFVVKDGQVSVKELGK